MAIATGLAAIQANRLVTQSETSHRRLEVANDTFQRRVQLETEEGNTFTIAIPALENE